MISSRASATLSVLFMLLCSDGGIQAFSPSPLAAKSFSFRLADSAEESAVQSFDAEEAADPTPASNVPAGMNPDRPELPELKGDFDWDAKFSQDDDWITEDVPGREVLNEIELAAQVTALTKLEETWRKKADWEDYDSKKQVGWVTKAETMNGRFAMFFLVTGLLTELWTGISFPGQVEELLRVSGVIGFD
mmetsp:Transcript_8732/g.11573  ORF Transcript_8732/g.11573 Transcript_8732/m.11573 type:complete len:191 (-) Transcript_8732:210-782(-)